MHGTLKKSYIEIFEPNSGNQLNSSYIGMLQISSNYSIIHICLVLLLVTASPIGFCLTSFINKVNSGRRGENRKTYLLAKLEK
jgi:hypothetical protein